MCVCGYLVFLIVSHKPDKLNEACSGNVFVCLNFFICCYKEKNYYRHLLLTELFKVHFTFRCGQSTTYTHAHRKKPITLKYS